jgi:hypothetical protein
MAEAEPSDEGSEYSDVSDDSTGLLSISETEDLCNIHYSREATVAAFEDYFEFLTAMYMDPAVIQTPPEGGWPQITVESMRPLGKTDEVVDLLRHLPYIRQDTDDGIQGMCWKPFGLHAAYRSHSRWLVCLVQLGTEGLTDWRRRWRLPRRPFSYSFPRCWSFDDSRCRNVP